MQDKFVLKALKKVAAISTGAVMLGATLTGALALDLADYPSPFVMDGVYDDANVFVYGDNALAADTAAIGDITAALQFESKTPVETAGATVTVSGGATEKVPLGKGFSNTTFFDKTLQDDDISFLFDGSITYRGKTYDTSEELQFCDQEQPSVVTSLMSSDDDYGTDVFIETAKDTIKYAYKFDKAINISDASTSYPLKIDFLGKTLKITAVAATQISAYVGEEYYMNSGDSVTVEGKTVKLVDASTTSAIVEVDGVQDIVASGNTNTVNGLEITVDSVFSRTSREESGAQLVIGTQSAETYDDGEAYVGEDVDDPNWVWDIAGLTGVATSTSVYDDCETGTNTNVLRIENDFAWNDDSDNPAGVGDCIDLPNNYLSICLDSLSVADWATYTFEYTADADLSDAIGSSYNSVKALHLQTDQSEGFEIRATDTTYDNETTSSIKAKELWLYKFNGTGMMNATNVSAVDIFYKQTASPFKVKLFGSVTDVGGTDTLIARVNYDNTKDDNMRIYADVLGAGATYAATGSWNLTLDVKPDVASSDVSHGADATLRDSDDLSMSWKLLGGQFNQLGATQAYNDAGELYWGTSDLSTKDEDHMTYYGIKVIDPKSTSSSDKVKLMIPNDQVMANIVIKGEKSTVGSGSTSYVPAKISPKMMAAGEVASPSSYNLVVVGGPCANDLAGSLFGVSCEGWGLSEGEAMVKLVENGDKVAMLVAGTSALDTQRAGKAIAGYADYAFSGEEVVVKGTTLTDISVEPPTVAPVEEEVVEEEAAEEEVVEEEAEV
ncbi:MAG: hypothetical protein ABIB71_01405 [Candidatus Woesearchaeota archaeon]